VSADGALGLAAWQPSGGRGPRHFALAPGGRFVLVANQQSDNLVVLPWDDPNAPPAARLAVSQAVCVQFAGSS
jgi:6-phosphogluconolactonase